MGFTPFEFDESVAQTEPGRPHVPEGYYLLAGIKAEPTPEDFDKTTGVYVTWKFKEANDGAGGSGVGREIRDYIALGAPKKNDRGTQFGLGMMLGAVGMPEVAKKLPGAKMDTYAKFASFVTALSARIAGKDVVALFADTMGAQGRTFSSLEEYLPADEWGNLKRSVMRPPTAAVPRANGSAGVATPAEIERLKGDVSALFET